MKKYSDEWFVTLYLQYGSVEEAVRRYPESLPISIANFHRLVRKFGLVKSAGRHVSLPETLHFFRTKALEPGAPLERVYKQMPLSFKTSLSTLHRIYQYIEKQTVRRYAAALVIVGTDQSVLVGNELTGNSRYGKKIGDVSVPMSFAKEDESNFESALRVLQQEVFTDFAKKGELSPKSRLTQDILPRDIEPLAYFDIVDVRVKIFSLVLPEHVNSFSSYKLSNHRFEDLSIVDKSSLREGIEEILSIYSDSQSYSASAPSYHVSAINLELAYRPI